MESLSKNLFSRLLLVIGSSLIGIAWYEQSLLDKNAEFVNFLFGFPGQLLVILGAAWIWVVFFVKLWQNRNFLRSIVLFIIPFIFFGLVLSGILFQLHSSIMMWYRAWIPQAKLVGNLSALAIGIILILASFCKKGKVARAVESSCNKGLYDLYPDNCGSSDGSSFRDTGKRC